MYLSDRIMDQALALVGEEAKNAIFGMSAWGLEENPV